MMQKETLSIKQGCWASNKKSQKLKLVIRNRCKVKSKMTSFRTFLCLVVISVMFVAVELVATEKENAKRNTQKNDLNDDLEKPQNDEQNDDLDDEKKGCQEKTKTKRQAVRRRQAQSDSDDALNGQSDETKEKRNDKHPRRSEVKAARNDQHDEQADQVSEKRDAKDSSKRRRSNGK